MIPQIFSKSDSRNPMTRLQIWLNNNLSTPGHRNWNPNMSWIIRIGKPSIRSNFIQESLPRSDFGQNFFISIQISDSENIVINVPHPEPQYVFSFRNGSFHAVLVRLKIVADTDHESSVPECLAVRIFIPTYWVAISRHNPRFESLYYVVVNYCLFVHVVFIFVDFF